LTKPIIVTYSSLAKFNNCQRAYKYRCVDEVVPIRFTSEPLTFGRLIHSALETWFKTRDKNTTMEALRNDLINSEWGLEDPKSLQIIAMINGYINYNTTDKDWVVEAVEAEFEQPIGGEFIIRGKVDGVIKVDNLRYILEHKSAARVDYGYLSKLQGDFQSLTYAFFYPQHSNQPVHGVCYDILQKPGIKPRAKETPTDYTERLDELYSDGSHFHREFLHFSQEEFEDYRLELYRILSMLLDSYSLDFAGDDHAFPKNMQFCFSWNRPCPYFQLCRSLDNPTIKENFYKHERAHSELSGPEEIPF